MFLNKLELIPASISVQESYLPTVSLFRSRRIESLTYKERGKNINDKSSFNNKILPI